jgi:hypothetical protein
MLKENNVINNYEGEVVLKSIAFLVGGDALLTLKYLRKW